MSESRTIKSIKNARIALFYYLVNILVGFWARKVFFDYLGSEILGLDTTASNLLGFLNIAELGVSTSAAYFLYKPLNDNDHLSINKVVALQGWIYRRIACFILVSATVLMCFFPKIFAGASIPLWCAYATFGVMLVGSMLGYFINYKSIVLTADQKGYKVSKVTQGALLAVKIFVLLIMPYVSYPFFYYLGMNLFGYVFGCIWLCYVIKKEYPWLNDKGFNGKDLLREMPAIITKTKQLFVHRVSGVIFVQVCPFLMYAFTSLTIIAYYGNYLLVIGKFSKLIETAFSSTASGIGSLIASNNPEHTRRVFWELVDSRLFISWVSLFCIYFLVQPFICLWLGPEYKLSNSVVMLLTLQQGITMNRTTVDSYLAGNGQFSDVWAPVVEGILTFGLAYGFGAWLGLEGVLLGIIITQTIFVGIWKPYFLFVKGFKWRARDYFIPYTIRCTILLCASVVYIYIFSLCDNSVIHSWHQWIIYSIVVMLFIVISLFIPFFFLGGMKDFLKRMRGVVQGKIKA